ncbi:MAG: ORF6N domain-containing protein, partial [bacterium]
GGWFEIAICDLKMGQAMKSLIPATPVESRIFMFQTSGPETSNLKSQFVISSWGGRRHRPFAFTEQGVAMLSSVLRSRRAVRVNVEIMRAFVRIREVLATRQDLAEKIAKLERVVMKHDKGLRAVFAAIRRLMAPPRVKPRRIGFVGDS